MNINDKYFCVVPFVQLNTRGKGDARVCCSIDGLDWGIPKEKTVDDINDGDYHRKEPHFNLQHDKIEDLWNSKFMKHFRIKMLNGDYIPNCEFCHKMESSGLTSKRLGKNARFLEKTKPYLQKYYDANGHVDKMPQWWEIRLSTKCNLSCIMCTPVLSSMMQKEYTKWEKEDKNHPVMQGSLEMSRMTGGEYLSSSEFFKQQIIDNLEHCLFMEFRGGEVFADKPSIKFIDTIGDSKYAQNIELDISTNATLITDEVIEVLNKFKGGTLRFSIDAFDKEDEFIRYHTDWNSVIGSMNKSKQLHSGWKFLTQTTVQLLNCLSMDKLIRFFDEYIKEDDNRRFHLGFTTVRGKDYLRHEMVPLTQRQEQIFKLQKLKEELYIFTEHTNRKTFNVSVDRLISSLGTIEYNDKEKNKLAVSYFKTLSELREIDYFEMFPQLGLLNE